MGTELGESGEEPGRGVVMTKKRKPQTVWDEPALLHAVKDEKGHVVAFGRTKLGQAVYDVIFSSMSAKKAAKKHGLSRESVLQQRREWREHERKRERSKQWRKRKVKLG